MSRRWARQRERGAAAVEFAIVAMLFLTLLLGIVEFGYGFFVQGTLAGSAREGAREYAISRDVIAGELKARETLDAAGLTAATVSIPDACPAGAGSGTSSVTVTVTYPNYSLTGFFGTFNLTGTGTMRCGG